MHFCQYRQFAKSSQNRLLAVNHLIEIIVTFHSDHSL